MSDRPKNKTEASALGHRLLKERVANNPSSDNKEMLNNYEKNLQKQKDDRRIVMRGR